MGKEMTLGSLFDGIAGFPLAAAQNGIKRWRDTTSRHHQFWFTVPEFINGRKSKGA